MPCLISLLVLSGCVAVEPPGEEVGTFTISGELVQNNCGQEAVPVFPRLDFKVILRRDHTIAYWDRSDSPMVEGIVEGTAEIETPSIYTFEAYSALRARDPNAPPDIPDCLLSQTERIDFDLLEEPDEASEDGDEETADAGADVNRSFRLTGTQTVEWSPSSLRSCGYLLWTQGGPFDALPCGVTYTLDGATHEASQE